MTLEKKHWAILIFLFIANLNLVIAPVVGNLLFFYFGVVNLLMAARINAFIRYS